MPFRCPRCARHKPFTYKVKGRMRYHRCQLCGMKYKSWELHAGAITVRDWDAAPEVPQSGPERGRRQQPPA